MALAILQGNATLKGNGEDVNDNNQAGNNRLLSVAEVATEMGVSRKTVYGWTYREPRLPVKRDGRRVFIASESLKLHYPSVEQTPVCASTQQEKDQDRAETGLPQDQVTENTIVAPKEKVLEHSTGASSGQRELTIRQRYGLGIAVVLVPSFHALR